MYGFAEAVCENLKELSEALLIKKKKNELNALFKDVWYLRKGWLNKRYKKSFKI